MALARDMRGEDYRVVAVCGDGAMSGGLCYEALNNVGYLRPDMLIILNDNKMSISPNIGAMSHYFNQIVTTDLDVALLGIVHAQQQLQDGALAGA